MLSVSLFFFCFPRQTCYTYKKCVCFVLSSNFLLVCLLQSKHKGRVAVYKVFNCNDVPPKGLTAPPRPPDSFYFPIHALTP